MTTTLVVPPDKSELSPNQVSVLVERADSIRAEAYKRKIPLNRIASEDHMRAMRTACSRVDSYVSILSERGYEVAMDMIRTFGSTKQWNSIFFLRNPDGNLDKIYFTVFVDNGESGSCRFYRTCTCSMSEKERVNLGLQIWRCGFRWADICQCPEDGIVKSIGSVSHKGKTNG